MNHACVCGVICATICPRVRPCVVFELAALRPDRLGDMINDFIVVHSFPFPSCVYVLNVSLSVHH